MLSDCFLPVVSFTELSDLYIYVVCNGSRAVHEALQDEI